MILFTDNQVDSAIVSEENETINFPASNVQNSLLSRIFKGGQSVNFDINAGGSLKNISQAYTNLVQDPTDLTAGTWTMNNGLVAASTTLTINGLPLTKLTTDGTVDPQAVGDSVTVTTGVKHTGYVIIRNESTTGVAQLFFITGVANSVFINWTTKVVTLNAGDKFKYNFMDDNTVEIWLTTTADAAVSLSIRIDPFTTSGAGEVMYVTAVQLVDNTTTYFPFVDGTHSADIIDETFTMPDRFTIDMIVTPSYAYDTATNRYICSYNIDGTHFLDIVYAQNVDKFQVFYIDGGVIRNLASQQFDDGGALTNLNQRIRIIASLDLVSGGTNDSRFIVIPLESGVIAEDTTWSSTPDIKTSTFPTLSIGHNSAGIQQATSSYEYLRIYEGLLVGTVTSSDDVDTLLEPKKILFDKTYQSKITATDLSIANNTINDGDSVLLRANNVDSFGPGTPLDEVVQWSKNIIEHNFLKSTYQFYRIIASSSNVIEMGRVYLGPRFESPGIKHLVVHDRKSASKKSTSISGQSYLDKRFFFSLVQVKFPKITEDEYNEIVEIFEAVDIGIPFFIKFEKAGKILQTLYVTYNFDGLKLTPLGRRNLYTTAMEFIEEVK